MIVRCKFRELTDAVAATYGASPLSRPIFQISAGKTYSVISISPMCKNPVYGPCTMLAIADDAGRLAFVPLYFFEIEDGSPSEYWKSIEEDGFVSFSHPELGERFFADDLSEGDPEVVAKWEKIKSLFKTDN